LIPEEDFRRSAGLPFDEHVIIWVNNQDRLVINASLVSVKVELGEIAIL
jgi:hypothetical protein